MKPRGRGVLDRPVKPGDDSGVSGYTINSSLRAKQSIVRQSKYELLRRGACHRARIRATRWLLAMAISELPQQRIAAGDLDLAGCRLEVELLTTPSSTSIE